MSSEQHKALARRYFEAFSNPDVFDEILTEEFSVRAIHRATLSPDSGRGPEVFKEGFRSLLASFPDSRVSVMLRPYPCVPV